MKNFECLKDFLDIQFCLGKISNSDQCALCAEGYYLNSTKYECKPNPDGIQFCITYSDRKTCTGCTDNYYL